MMGNVFKFENGLTLEVIVDVFGTNRKQSDWGAKGLRAHIKNADTCEQYDFDFYCGSGWKEEPTAKAVLESVLDECCGFTYCDNINDFVADYGYEDFNKAQKAYKACKKQYKKMVRVCGDVDFCDLYNELNEQ